MGRACLAVCSRLAAALLGFFLVTSAAVPSHADAQPKAAANGLLAVKSARDSSSALQPVTETAGKVKAGLLAKQTRDRFAALQQHSREGPEHLGGVRVDKDGHHFLTQKELDPITSVHCLQDKQRFPDRPCRPPDQSSYALRPLSIGNYPSWKDSSCHSNREFFCDPRQMLKPKEQVRITDILHNFRKRTLVSCGQLDEVLDPEVERRWFEKKHPVFQGRLGLEDYREFNLAVVLADEWPATEMDPRSMQYFGRILMSKWGLQPFYNGVDNGNYVNQAHGSWNEDHGMCPNAVILFILPRYHEAFLISPSCEFICGNRGGPEVVAATLAGLDRGGLEEAIQSGVDAVSRVLSVTLPLSVHQNPQAGLSGGNPRWRRAPDKITDETFVLGFRFIFVLILLILIISVVAFVYYLVLPSSKSYNGRGGYSRSNTYSRLIGAEGRQAFREEGITASTYAPAMRGGD